MKIGFGRVLIDGKKLCSVKIDFDSKKVNVVGEDFFADSEESLINESFTLSDIDGKKLKILPPTLPTKIVCVGLNYTDHAKELNMPLPEEPVIFLKPPSAVIGDRDNIIYPYGVSQLDYEGELSVVIGKKCRNVSEEESFDYILGYTCFNDVTARDLQRKDGQWTRAKSFDTFAPIGPFIVSGIKPYNLSIKTFLNDKIVQDSNTSNLIFSVEYIISFVSKIMTLYPGDVISLGTPVGVGPMKRGDKVVVKIEEIGELTNYVA